MAMRSRVCLAEPDTGGSHPKNKASKKKLKHFFKSHEKRSAEAAEMTRKDYVYPVQKPIKHKSFLVFDLESKKLDLQVKGFERPFMACLYDGDAYKSFGNAPKHKGRSYTEEFWHEPGGCIDSMMREILGLRACAVCKIKAGEDRFGGCEECIAARKKYQSKNWIIYAHNFGKFDGLYVLGWLKKHRKLFSHEIISVQSRMLILTIKLRRDAPGRGKKESWTFSDSIALIPLSLKEIGKTFFSDREDVQKIGFDLDLPEDDPDWDAYNQRDCLVLHEALCRFRDLVETIGGSIGMTAASTAMQIYRRAFMTEDYKLTPQTTVKRPIVIHRNLHFPDCQEKGGKCNRLLCDHHECAVERMPCHGCLHDFVREGFFGGRTEIYTMRGRNLFYYDLNSSYPSSMLKDMPVGPAKIVREGTPWKYLEMMNKHSIGFVECVVWIPENCYLPPLPYRYVTEGGSMKLVFPAGQMYGVWNFEELKLVFEVGGKILDVGKSVWYRRKKIFVDFVHKLYSYRKHKKTCPSYKDEKAECDCGYDEGMSYVAKLILNSLYGKWGMNPLREKLLDLDDDVLSDPDFDLQLSVFPPPNTELPARIQHVVEADYIVPQISATITAYSRITYWRGLNNALQETSKPIPGMTYTQLTKGKPAPFSYKGAVVYGKDRQPRAVAMRTLVYGDTDSCTAKVPMKPEGRELGQWKAEEVNIHMIVEQPKFYYYTRHKKSCRAPECSGCEPDKKGKTDKVRMKGVPRSDVDGNSLQTREVFDHLRGEANHSDKSRSLAMSEGGVPELVFERLMAAKSMIRHDRSSPVMENVRRSMQSTYDKRRIYEDGTTMPLVIHDPPTVASARMLIREKKLAA